MAINDVEDNVNAYIKNSKVTATGHSVTVNATESATIDAFTIGGAVAVGVSEGFLGVGVAAAGAGSGNTVSNNVYANISGNSTVKTLNAGDVIVTATDSSSIEAIAGGLAVGIGIGLELAGLGASLGVAAASNNIENNVKAYVDSSVVTSAGMVQIAATEQASIFTVTIGGAVSLGLGVGELLGVGIGLAVAGSDSSSNIADNIDAYVSDGSTVTAGGSVSIDATDNSSITAGGGGIAVAVGIGAGVFAGGLAFAAGFAVATNNIQNSVLAYVSDSSVSATDNNVSVAAVETSSMTAVTVGGAVSIGVGAGIGAGIAVAIGVGYSSNTSDNTVEAYLTDGAQVTTNTGGNVTLTATDSPNLDAITVAASVGISGGIAAGTVTASAAIASNNVEDTVEAFSIDSTITSAGQITASAVMPDTATIDATVVAASAAVAIGAGAAFAAAGADATNTVNDTIESFIEGPSSSAPSTITATGAINLSAAENATINSQIVAVAGAVAIAGGSVGISVAQNTVDSTITAYVDNAKVTSSAGDISIGASSSDSVNTLSVATSIAAALGGAGAGAGASATVNPAVEAYEGSGATLNAAGSISIAAGESNSAAATTFGIAVGFLAIGTSAATATADGSSSAQIYGAITGCANLTVQAAAADSSNTLAFALAGGIIAGSGAAAISTTAPGVMAAINNNSTITASGTVQVSALQTPYASAESIGVDVGGVSIGVNVSTATVSGKTSSYLGNSVTISAPSLFVDASRSANENSQAYAGAGGILAGLNATDSTAQAMGSVQATTGTAILTGGNVTIEANSSSDQSATATGVAIGGFFALGLDFATATSGVTTLAQLGAGATTNITGTLNVSATGTDQNTANSIAGSGAIVGGNAAEGNTSDTSTVNATLGAGNIGAYAVELSAQNNSEYLANVSSVNAALAGYSGASATNSDTITAVATVASNTNIVATNAVEISAQDSFAPVMFSGSTGQVSAGAGGVFVGNAASITTTLSGLANVVIGSGVTIIVMTPSINTNSPGIVLSASSTLTTNDVVTLSTGGLVDSANTGSQLTATLTNNVQTGASDNFDTNQSITMDTNTTVNALNSTGTNTWGILGSGAYATTDTDVTSNQSVTLGGSSTLMALGDVSLTPGDLSSYDASKGLTTTTPTVISGNSNAQSYVSAAIAVPGASATTNLTSNATLYVATGDQIISGENTTVAADPGTTNPVAQGVGHGTSYILFGIPISYTNGSSSAPAGQTTSTVTLDGTITAGYYHELTIDIPNAKNVSYNNGSGNVLYTNTSAITVNPDGQPFLPFSAYFTTAFNPSNSIGTLAPGSGTNQNPLGLLPQQLAAIQLAEGYVAPGTVGAIELGPLSAAGGDVTVGASNLEGNGAGSITAYGGATISITNESPDYLILDSIDVQGNLGGNINFTGAAASGAAAIAGISLAAVNPNGKPVVNIQESYAQTVGGPTSQKPGGIGPSVFMSASLTAVSFTGTLTNGSAVVGISGTTGQQIISTTGVQVGQSVTGTGIPQGTTIKTITATSITLSAPATLSGLESLSAAGGVARFNAGTLNNPDGQVTINVVNGSLIQTESVNAASVSTTATNGFDLVFEPNSYYSTGATPADGYNLNSVMIFPGSPTAEDPNPTTQQSADLAIAWAANATSPVTYPSTPAGDLAFNESFALLGNASDANLTVSQTEDDQDDTVWFTIGGNTSPIPYSESDSNTPTGTSNSQAQSFDTTYLLDNADRGQTLAPVPFSSDFVEFSGQVTVNSNLVTILGSTAGLKDGQAVNGSYLPAGTTITNVNSSAGTITLSANATVPPFAGEAGPFTFTGTLSTSSNQVTGLSNAALIALSVGDSVTDGTHIPSGTTITFINDNTGTITLSAKPAISGSQTITAEYAYFSNEHLYVPTTTASTNPNNNDGWFPAVPVEPLSMSLSTLPAQPSSTAFTGNLTNNSATVSGISNTAVLLVGETVTGSPAILPGTTITAINRTNGSITLSQSVVFSGSQLFNQSLSAGFPSSLNAAAIFIDAEYIDINDPVNIDAGTSVSVNLPASLDQMITSHNGNGDLNLTQTTLSSGNTEVTAYYDPATKQIILNNLSASSAGFVSLYGGIVSTSQGEINVGDGLGTVTIANQTGYPVVVNNVSASPAPGSPEVSEVDINDTLQSQSPDPQTLYVYDPGGGIEEYQGTASASAQQLQQGLAAGDWLPPTLISGSSTTYSPRAGMRLEWQYEATLSRTFSFTYNPSLNVLNSTTVPTIGAWGFDTPNTNDSVVGEPDWEYVNPVTGAPEPAPTSELLFNQPGGPAFQETISDQVNAQQAVHWYYPAGTDGFASGPTTPYGGNDNNGYYNDQADQPKPMIYWSYLFPTSVSVILTDSVSASNPIGINFTGPSHSSVSITSDASVRLAGEIVNTAGTTTITVKSDSNTIKNDPLSITAVSSSATILTDNLTLNAPKGSVGTMTPPSEREPGAASNLYRHTHGRFTIDIRRQYAGALRR